MDQYDDDRRIDLDALDADDYLGTEDAAAVIHKHPATLTRWRKSRKFLPYSQVGAEVRYQVQDIREFLKSARVEPIGGRS